MLQTEKTIISYTAYVQEALLQTEKAIIVPLSLPSHSTPFSAKYMIDEKRMTEMSMKKESIPRARQLRTCRV